MAVAVPLIIVPVVAATAPLASAQVSHPAVSPDKRSHINPPGLGDDQAPLQAPPKPPKGKPAPPTGWKPPKPPRPRLAAAGAVAPAASVSAGVVAAATRAATPSQAKTWGSTSSGSATTLVLYDSTNTYGWLGELYGMAAGNLASHFGTVTAEPVVDYVSGQVNSYTSTIYLGSTYNEPIPTTFLSDVLTTTKPVIWAGYNVWQLTGPEGSTSDTAFKTAYGWDPSNSYFDSTDDPLTVSYKGQSLTRNTLAGATVLAPDITTASQVTTLASANCTSSTGAATTCASIAQSTGTSFPWAIRSSNLTYVGEIPLSYISERDRYLAFSDLLFAALNPGAAPSHQALVRLEDVSPESDPSELEADANYLSSVGVPFSVAVIPEYTDPNGYYNNGVAQTVTLAQAPTVVAALKYMQSKGGTLIEHGYTHQYSNVANPYDGVSADDAEFYRAQCSSTQNPPYSFDSPCPNTDWVVWTGPLSGDSQSWAANRAKTGQALFTAAGLTKPTIWETPHYFASAADYAGIDSVYSTRYERENFVGGQLSGGTLNYSHIFGQFFPYVVHDVYGEKIIPEDLGNYEDTEENNNPPRLPADIIANAQADLAVTQGVASFFFHPYYPLTDLEQIVAGIKGLGYTFVAPTSLSG